MKSKDILNEHINRRSTREFSSEHVDIEIIRDCIKTANLAPNGANMQPWHFVIVKDNAIKKELREKCQEIEKTFYEEKISKQWANDLAPLNVDYQKPFLEQAPYLIVIFKQMYTTDNQGIRHSNYYVTESCSIAIGFLISSLHRLGISSLTYTPAPIEFLKSYFKRPDGEVPVMILAVGKSSKNYQAPDINKKSFDEIATII